MKTFRAIAKQISDSYCPLDEETLDSFSKILVKKDLSKGEVVIVDGQISKYMIYVEHGMIRQFYYKNGRDMAEYFSYEGNMVIIVWRVFLSRSQPV